MEADQSEIAIQTDCPSNEAREQKSKKPRVPSLRLNTGARSKPRIAELKAQEKEVKTAREKQQQESQLKKRNENLILRNFKKEYDQIMMELGLGKVITRETQVKQ